MQSEWGIPFHVIENEWTDRQFAMMSQRLAERYKKRGREASIAQARGGGAGGTTHTTTMKYTDWAKQDPRVKEALGADAANP